MAYWELRLWLMWGQGLRVVEASGSPDWADSGFPETPDANPKPSRLNPQLQGCFEVFEGLRPDFAPWPLLYNCGMYTLGGPPMQ